MWSRSGTSWKVQVLPELPDGQWVSYGLGINGRGQVAGEAVDAQGYFQPVVWDPGPTGYTARPLPLPTGAVLGVPYDINALGETAGVYYILDNGRPEVHAVFWNREGQVVPLPDLVVGCSSYYDQCSLANGLNERGQVTGYAWAGNDELHAVRWDIR